MRRSVDCHEIKIKHRCGEKQAVSEIEKAADADNLKAKLALTGLEAGVQEVSIPEKGTMHRVRVGPFRSAEEMNKARVLLSQNGVQGTVIKQKE